MYVELLPPPKSKHLPVAIYILNSEKPQVSDAPISSDVYRTVESQSNEPDSSSSVIVSSTLLVQSSVEYVLNVTCERALLQVAIPYVVEKSDKSKLTVIQDKYQLAMVY